MLAVADGDEPAAVYRLNAAETVLGRGGECDLSVADDEVSKRHCVLRVDGPTCTLTDLESLNGTFVNGRRLRDTVAVRLRHLDEVQLGTTRLILLTGRFRSQPK